MPRIDAFDRYPELYDRWYDEHPRIYQSEVQALEQVIPWSGAGLEIGVATARFAAPLHIAYGIDASPRMARIARERGIHVAIGTAGALPFCSGSFDFVVMVTVLCFIDDPARAFREAKRVMKPDGSFFVALVDRDSSLYHHYRQDKETRLFFEEALFYSVREVLQLLDTAGLSCHEVIRAVFQDQKENADGFVIVKAMREPQ
jgi:SAM-dependent methyltransferase